MKLSHLVKEVKILKLQSNDILIIKCKRKINEAGQRFLRKTMEEVVEKIGLKNKVEVVVADKDIDVKVVRPEKNGRWTKLMAAETDADSPVNVCEAMTGKVKDEEVA